MGLFRIQISGNLGDMVANLQKFIDDLTAVGIDPTPLKAANVIITFQTNITNAQNTLVVSALTTWRTQVAGTSIVAVAEFATSE